MPASVEILNVPIGSVLTSSIGANDEADKNDFTVLLLWGENVAFDAIGHHALGGCNACVALKARILFGKVQGASAPNGWNGDGDRRGECGHGRECPNL